MNQFGNIRHNLYAIIIGILIVFPVWVYSAGLVPCGGYDEEPCQTCHVVELISNVVNWLIVILGFLAALVIIYAGTRLVISSGNTSEVQKAKSIFSNFIIGYVIVLAAWLIIDYGLKSLVNSDEIGPWNTISCIQQEEITQRKVEFINLQNVTATGFNSSTFTPVQINTAASTIAASGDVRAMTEAAARQAGLSGDQVKIFVALVYQESNMCRNMISPAGALGCGQLLLSTALQLDPSATRDRLLNDNAYNLALSAQYYAQQLSRFGETRLALAAYNGGPGANQPSRDCPGLRRWECVWDSPGCYNTSRTDCTPNTGYIETRNYVTNIMSTAARL
jgi:soluble lytic murein transglycosylase-like protein